MVDKRVGMSFAVFTAWGVAILFAAHVADLAGADSRVAFGLGGFAFGIVYTIHFERRWDQLRNED